MRKTPSILLLTIIIPSNFIVREDVMDLEKDKEKSMSTTISVDEDQFKVETLTNKK